MSIHSKNILVILACFLMTACSTDYENMGKLRSDWAKKQKGDINIVAVTPQRESNYTKGILLAVDEINQQKGKLLGRSLNVQMQVDGGNIDESTPLIRRIISNPKITAVLGHRSSSIAVPASMLYERGQVIFLPSFSTAKGLTGHGFKYVFRMAPSNSIMSTQLASAAKMLGYQNIAILYSRNDLDREVAFMFENEALRQGINITKRSSFFEQDANYRNIIAQLNTEPFEAVFIASGSVSGARMVQQLRDMGIQTPILGTDSFTNANYALTGKETTNKTIVPSIYQSTKKDPITKQFNARYYSKYKELPDYNAAQGYDSVKLLAHAIKLSGSTLTPLISSTLHFMPAWVGVTGLHSYDEVGELFGKKYFFQTWREGELHNLPAIHSNYYLKRFQNSRKKPEGNQSQTDFTDVFSKSMHDDDSKIYMLDLAHDILQFKRLGVILENTINGKKLADHALLVTLGEQKDIQIVPCEIPFSILSDDEIKKEMLSCYGKLSLSVDVIFLPTKQVVKPSLQQQLNAGLSFFKIPTISLNEKNEDPNVTFVITKRRDVNKASITNFSGLLNNQRVHEFEEKIRGLPEISANLQDLQKMDIPDNPIILTSPDTFIQTGVIQ